MVAGYGAAFGMNVLVWGRERSRAARARRCSTTSRRTAGRSSRTADIVTLHLRLNDETRGIVTLEDLQAMKPTALLVNTSRAELIAPGALIQALNNSRPGLAAVDVFETEPPLAGNADAADGERGVHAAHRLRREDELRGDVLRRRSGTSSRTRTGRRRTS